MSSGCAHRGVFRFIGDDQAVGGGGHGAARPPARRAASTTANRSGSAAARARNPSRTRRWKARSNSASKRVTSPGALRARPTSTGTSRRIVRSGLSPSVAVASSVAQRVERDAGAVALVGEGRIGEARADDRPTRVERRPDDLGHELAPGGVEQQRVGQRVGRGGRSVRASRTSRSRSPSHVPPGSRVRWTSQAASRECVGERVAWVVLPAPSGPSIVMNQPRVGRPGRSRASVAERPAVPSDVVRPRVSSVTDRRDGRSGRHRRRSPMTRDATMTAPCPSPIRVRARRAGSRLVASRPCSLPPSRPRTRSATSRSTTTPGSGSSRIGSCSTSSSTRRRSRPSRRASASTPTATARSPTTRPTPAAWPPASARDADSS